MATIHCKACGAIYRYEKEGCCPHCGAYNRPPKRERVNADGTVQHMTDAAYVKRKYEQGKVCFEEKECHEKKESYEKKVCYEDQARQGNRTKPSPSAGSTVYAKPSEQAPREYHSSAPAGQAPHARFPETSGTPVKSTADANKRKKLPIGCLIPLIFIGIEVVGAVIALIKEVLSDIF